MISIVDRMKPLQELENKKRYILDFFGSLEFNVEEHKYNVEDVKLKSVTTVIKDFTEPFDADRIAGYVAKSRKISKAEVLAEWEAKRIAACNKGNRVHDFGENYTGRCKPTDGYEEAVVAFWKSLPSHIHPFINELKMYSKESGIAGTADIILYNSNTGKFIIADYKTNIDLFKNYKNKKMLAPFGTLLDNPFNKYQLQLSFYQYLFEQSGLEIEDRKIIWLKPDSTFKTYRTKDYREKLKHILK